MNLTPLIQKLRLEDFHKMLRACSNRRERFYLEAARCDPGFEYHVDLPRPDGEQVFQDMATWLADEKNFPEEKFPGE